MPLPRGIVAAALGLPPETDALPPGDLPLDRFLERYLAYLAKPEAEAGTETEDAWTGAVMDHLIAFEPEAALDVVICGARTDAGGLLVDVLLDLNEAAPQLDVAGRAADDPAFAGLLARARART